MTLTEAIREFFVKKAAVSIQDLYAHLPDRLEHSIRARIYENLGKLFRRVDRGVYVAIEGEAACVVVQGDASEKIREIPSQSVDLLLTDPPYAWLDHFVAQGTTRRRMKWSFDRKDIERDLGLELYRVLKEGAHAFVFVPAETNTTKPHIDRLLKTLEDCGFVFRKRFIWEKQVLGMGYSGRATYEGILFLTRGLTKRKPCDFTVRDVISERLIDPAKRRHPTQKPVGLLEKLIRFATRAGETVLDIFAGSLSTGIAALRLGRNAILIEKDETLLGRALLEADLT